MGGNDNEDNLIELTIEEHAEMHKILYEKYGKKEDYLAWKGLLGQIDIEEIIEEKCSIGGKNNKNIPKTEEHKNKISETLIEFFSNEEERIKVSERMKGNINSKNHSSKEYKKKQSEAMKKAWKKRKENSKK
jgi:hypothetical protein